MATAAFAPVSTGILVPAAAADQYPESFDKTFKQTLIRTVDGFDEQQYRERYADCELDEHTTDHDDDRNDGRHTSHQHGLWRVEQRALLRRLQGCAAQVLCASWHGWMAVWHLRNLI